MITTKTGDDGTTFNGKERVYKDHRLITLLGEIDELTCVLGLNKTQAKYEFHQEIEKVQFQLYLISGYISTGSAVNLFLESWTSNFESDIELWTEELPPLKEFIRPAGSIQLARAVCRRVERSLVEIINRERYLADIDNIKNKLTFNYQNELMAYFNRFSDWLFMLARKDNEQ